MWKITYEPMTRELTVRLREHVGSPQVRDLAEAQARALEAAGDAPFRVFLDLRWTQSLDNEAVGLLAELKLVAARQPGFRGLVVLVDSATNAMQQKRTSITEKRDGARELVTLDADEAARFLDSISTN